MPMLHMTHPMPERQHEVICPGCNTQQAPELPPESRLPTLQCQTLSYTTSLLEYMF